MSISPLIEGRGQAVPLVLKLGGTGARAFTAGSIIFSDGTVLSQDNANLFWDNTNKRLGIGTASPSYPLHVQGLYFNGLNTGANAFSLNNPGPAYMNIRPQGAGGSYSALEIGQATLPTTMDSVLMHIRNNGNVGIGTTSPSYLLHLKAAIPRIALERTNDANGAFLSFLDSTGTIRSEVQLTGTNIFTIGTSLLSNYPMQFMTNATGAIYIDTSQKVGIGTTSPGAQLNVTSAIEIFQTAALTAGSVGSLIAPYDTAATETDAKGGNLNGAIVVNNADLKIYARTGGVWKGVAIASLSIDPDEQPCRICHKQMKPGDYLAHYADKWYTDGQCLHAIAVHLNCAMLKTKNKKHSNSSKRKVKTRQSNV